MDPPPDYPAESSRSDLSDILEEEEEDLYSESTVDVSPRNYTSGLVGRVSRHKPTHRIKSQSGQNKAPV